MHTGSAVMRDIETSINNVLSIKETKSGLKLLLLNLSLIKTFIKSSSNCRCNSKWGCQIKGKWDVEDEKIDG